MKSQYLENLRFFSRLSIHNHRRNFCIYSRILKSRYHRRRKRQKFSTSKTTSFSESLSIDSSTTMFFHSKTCFFSSCFHFFWIFCFFCSFFITDFPRSLLKESIDYLSSSDDFCSSIDSLKFENESSRVFFIIFSNNKTKLVKVFFNQCILDSSFIFFFWIKSIFFLFFFFRVQSLRF